jgi:hypothetical protein
MRIHTNAKLSRGGRNVDFEEFRVAQRGRGG